MGRSKTKWNDLILNWNEKFYQKKFYEKFQQKYFSTNKIFQKY